MLLHPHRRLFFYTTNYNKSNLNSIFMASKHFLLLSFSSTSTPTRSASATPPSPSLTSADTTTKAKTLTLCSSQSGLFITTRTHRQRRLLFPFLSSSRTFSSTPHPAIPRPVLLEDPEQHLQDSAQMRELRQKLEEFGIDGDFQKPGQYTHLICPKCGGGDSMERSLSLFIEQDGEPQKSSQQMEI